MSKPIFLVATLLVVSWIVMTTSHELGHLVGGWLGGAQLTEFDLAPWRLPYSLHNPDPHPLVTLWCGPIIGILFPMGLAAIIRDTWAWFIADFCLIANGSYLATGWYSGDRFLDTARLLEANTPPVVLAAFCLLTIGFGYLRFRADCVKLLQRKSTTSSTPQ